MKTKEEKEVLEHFAGVVSFYVPCEDHMYFMNYYIQCESLYYMIILKLVTSCTNLTLILRHLQFTMMSMTMFKEVFTELIDYLVERIQTNYALQILPNALLANNSTSATFASILLGFLLKVGN